jgi:hypothetical protein
MKRIGLLIAAIFFICLSAYGQTDDLVAYYPFNGNANDESGNGHDGTVNGATLTTDRFGNENSAYSFDGVNDYIAAIDQIITTGLTEFTIAAWIKSGGEQNELAVPLSQGCASYQGIAFQYGWPTATDFIFIAGPESGDWSEVQFNTDLEADLEWHMYTITYDGINFISYKDDQEQAELASSLELGTSHFTIGQDTENPDRFFNGKVDDIRIFDYALTANEVSALFNENQSDMLIAYYPFNGNANDESGNGHDGTVNGATLTTDRFGNENSAYSFDGENDEIIIPNSTDFNLLNGFTFSSWIKADSWGENSMGFILCRRISYTDENGGYIFGFNPSQLSIHFIGLDGTIGAEVEEQLDETFFNSFHLVTATFDGITLKLYLDGDLVGSETSITSMAPTDVDLVIGNTSAQDQVRSFDGIIDEVRIYNYALSDNEITDLYDETTSLETNSSRVLSFYPNPTHGQLVISGLNDETLISLYAISGKLFKVVNVSSDKQVIDISDLAPGIYLLRISSNDVNYIEKVIRK